MSWITGGGGGGNTAEAKAYTDTQVNILKDGVDSTGDTLKKLRGLITAIQTLLNSNDANLDTLQEVVTYIKSNATVLEGVTISKVNVVDIIDDLVHTDANKPLSANQGKSLKALLDALTTVVADKGDMFKSIYDTDGDGKVDKAVQADNATKLNNHTASATPTTTEQIDLAEMVNEVNSGKENKCLTKDRFFCYLKCTQSPNYNPIYIVGDSITEGSVSLDFNQDGYANILVRAINKFTNTRNRGFVSFRDLTPYAGVSNFHTIVKQGFSDNNANSSFDSNYFGGIRVSSSVQGDYIEISYIGQYAKVVYGCRTDGGSLQITLDGTNYGTIDTTQLNGGFNNYCAQSNIISSSFFGKHTIRLTKLDNKPTDLCGMIYTSTASQSPIVYNVGRSSITLSEIPNYILDMYSGGGMAILALGVNDQFLSKDVATFKSKLEYFCNKVASEKGSLVICDFMFSLPESDPYKTAIREVAMEYPQFIYLDFAKIWFQNSDINKFSGLLSSDGTHPTIDGHEFIANTIMKYLGLPYTKQDLNSSFGYIKISDFKNGWTDADGGTYVGGLEFKQEDNTITFRGLVSSGTMAKDITIAVLPDSKYYPSKDQYLTAITDAGLCGICVFHTGEIKISYPAGTGWSYVSFCGLKYDLS